MTIKETAGKTLLYLYQLQRAVPLEMRNRQLGFLDKKGGGMTLTADKKWLTRDLLDINPKSSDIFNALMFLLEKKYISAKERINSGARIYIGIHVTTGGIDAIEGIEGGLDGRQAFQALFNIKVDDNMDVDELIKENLSKLLDN